jgi:hypothetical protein
MRADRAGARQINTWVDKERIRAEPIPEHAMTYMCPVCLEEGQKPHLIKHKRDCTYIHGKERMG